jgi:hypothetical protein
MATNEDFTNQLIESMLRGSHNDLTEAFDNMDPQSHGAEIVDTTKQKKTVGKPKNYIGKESAPTIATEEVVSEGCGYCDDKGCSKCDKKKKVDESSCGGSHSKKKTKKEELEIEDEILESLEIDIDGDIFIVEKKKGLDGKACWKGYKQMGTKKKGGKTVDNCVKMSYEPEGNYLGEKKLDPVGKEDKDIDNDGDHDKSDKYLLARRKKVSAIIGKKKKMKEEAELRAEIEEEKK